ncbi:PHP domain-containing protein [Candidatus Micrarchaeota archaeon]|nr:PHP domain-containing protein [Candidatus Micrarchaeota archaeon]
MRIDFHVHTNSSIDSTIDPKALARKSQELGIVPAIADHNSISSHAAMRALKAPFIPAEEIFTDHGDLIGLYVNELIPKKTPFLEAIDKIHSQGGLACLPHMFDHGRSGKHAAEADAAKVDIVEVFNARCMRKEYNEKAAAFAKKHGLPGAAGSDSHFFFEFGRTYAVLPDFDISNPSALLRTLKTQNTKLVTRKAPFFVRGTTTIVAMTRKLSRALRRTPPQAIGANVDAKSI